jgi:hypothetical protein
MKLKVSMILMTRLYPLLLNRESQPSRLGMTTDEIRNLGIEMKAFERARNHGYLSELSVSGR